MLGRMSVLGRGTTPFHPFGCRYLLLRRLPPWRVYVCLYDLSVCLSVSLFVFLCVRDVLFCDSEKLGYLNCDLRRKLVGLLSNSCLLSEYSQPLRLPKELVRWNLIVKVFHFLVTCFLDLEQKWLCSHCVPLCFIDLLRQMWSVLAARYCSVVFGTKYVYLH